MICKPKKVEFSEIWSFFGVGPEPPPLGNRPRKKDRERREAWQASVSACADTQRKLQSMWDDEATDAIVVFEVLDMCSSAFGMRQAMVVGPTRSLKSVADCEDKHLGDVPSLFAYPQYYCIKEGKEYGSTKAVEPRVGV